MRVGHVRANYEEVRGEASDLVSWHAALGLGGPPFHSPPTWPDGDFARLFRRAYGESPREWRVRAATA